jgi:ABC-2 type transport system permease protein
MRKFRAVGTREFGDRVRPRSFVISTVLIPLFFTLMIAGQIVLSTRGAGTWRIVVVDAAQGSLGARVEAALRDVKVGTGANAAQKYRVERIAAAPGRIDAVKDSLIPLTGKPEEIPGKLDGFLLVTEDALASGEIPYYGGNVGSLSEMGNLQAALRPVMLTERLVREGVAAEAVQQASGQVELVTSKVTDGKLTGESGESSFFLVYVMTLMMYFALLFYGIQVMSSVLEEKTSRIVEVLASSVTPFQLMLGKVVGVASVGLFQLGIWAMAGLYLTANVAPILSILHMSSDAAKGVQLPTVTLPLLAVFLLFFVLGFFLFASLYAAVGAMCSSQQDANQTQHPVTIGIVLGLMTMFPLMNDPNSTLARTLSLIPFTAPFATPIRYSVAPLPLVELLLSILATIAGVLIMCWIASRIYRIGILAYGKRPGLAELWRWVRTA